MVDGDVSAFAAEEQRICRAMLRHVAHPARLRGNALVERIAAAAGVVVATCSDETLCALVRTAIDYGLSALPLRQQTIVRRCDIGGERYADVARALFVSERHAYRERNAAIQCILTRLALPRALCTVKNRVDYSDLVEAQLAQARTLEHNGHGEVAVSLLEQIAVTTRDVGLQTLTQTRLVRLFVDAERFAEADQHLAKARSLLAGLQRPETWQAAEIDVAAARLAEARGNVDEANDLASRSCGSLRTALERIGDSRIASALIDALALRATLAVGHGAFDAAFDLAASAVELCDARRDVEPQFAIGARSIAAMTMLFGARDVARAERELVQCYRLATEAGLTREALVVATHLAGLYRLTKRPSLSIKMLTPLLGSARLVGTRECAAAVFSEVAAANLEVGDYETAAAYLTDVHAYALGHILMQPTAELLMARIHLVSQNFSAALGFARNAESGFGRIGKERLAGSALRLQAEALAGLGETATAIDAAQRSIEVLTGRSHPERLAAAYRVLGRLERDPAHLTTARKIVRAGAP